MRVAKSAKGLGAKLMDDDSRAIIYEGCSIGQLAAIFELDNRDISRRIRHIAPCGERMSYPIYALRDVAGALVSPDQTNLEEAIRKMSPRDLPASLTKEYWSGQHARLKYEEDAGDLWRTADVIEMLSEVFKTLRMSILLMADQVERNNELTPRQRSIIQKMIDNILDELAGSLIKRFENEKITGSSHSGGWTDERPEQIEESL